MGRDHSRQTEFPHQAGKPPVAQIPRRHLDRALFPQGVFPGIEGLPKQFHPPLFGLLHRKALIPQGFLPPQVKVAMRRHERHLCLFEQVSQYGRVHPAAESQKKTPPGEKFREIHSHVFQKPSVQAVFHPLALMDAKIRKAAVSDGLTPRPLLSYELPQVNAPRASWLPYPLRPPAAPFLARQPPSFLLPAHLPPPVRPQGHPEPTRRVPAGASLPCSPRS